MIEARATQNPAAGAHLGPTRSSERIVVLDVLRGFALLGIVLVNVQMASQPAQAVAIDLHPWTGALDRAAAWLVRVFAEGKFYPLFSFLFGLGFALQMQRIEARGGRFGGLYARRMLVLLGFGLIHALFIWSGDILTLYAVLGFVLLAFFRRVRPRTLLVWAGISLCVPALVNAAVLGLMLLGQEQPGGAAMVESVFAEQTAVLRSAGETVARAFSQGSFAEVQAARVQEALFLYSTMPFFLGPVALAMFLLGAYTVRRGLLHDLAAHRPLLRRLMLWGLSVGFAGSLFNVWAMGLSQRAVPSPLGLSATAASTLLGPVLSLGYAAALALLVVGSPAWERRLAPVAAAGRMALTNYLLQSLTFTFVLYNYGLGLFGSLGPAPGVLLSVAIYTVQLLLSPWWLARFQYGPAEWLWRSLTYGEVQPLRRPPTDRVGPVSPGVASAG